MHNQEPIWWYWSQLRFHVVPGGGLISGCVNFSSAVKHCRSFAGAPTKQMVCLEWRQQVKKPLIQRCFSARLWLATADECFKRCRPLSLTLNVWVRNAHSWAPTSHEIHLHHTNWRLSQGINCLICHVFQRNKRILQSVCSLHICLWENCQKLTKLIKAAKSHLCGIKWVKHFLCSQFYDDIWIWAGINPSVFVCRIPLSLDKKHNKLK